MKGGRNTRKMPSQALSLSPELGCLPISVPRYDLFRDDSKGRGVWGPERGGRDPLQEVPIFRHCYTPQLLAFP